MLLSAAGFAAGTESPEANLDQINAQARPSDLTTLQDQVERLTGHRPTEEELSISISVVTDGTNAATFRFEESEVMQRDDNNFPTEGIVHGPKAAFVITPSQGWLLDNQSGASQGLPCVLYPKGSTWEDQKVFMYAKIASPEHTNAEEFASWAISGMQKQPQGLQHKRVEEGKTTEGRPFFINEYRRERDYHRVESAAYAQLPEAVAYIVLTAESEELFDQEKDALKETIQSLLYAPSFIGFDAKVREALQKEE